MPAAVQSLMGFAFPFRRLLESLCMASQDKFLSPIILLSSLPHPLLSFPPHAHLLRKESAELFKANGTLFFLSIITAGFKAIYSNLKVT